MIILFEEIEDQRKDELLFGLKNLKTLRGLEIGPLDKPIISKQDGQVLYLDYTDATNLKGNYQNSTDHSPQDIVDVDVIWRRESLADLVGGKGSLDYVVASHVIEHIPDVLSWLRDISLALNQNGTLHLAIPDRRFCFDVLRQNTKISEVLSAYVTQADRPTPQQIIDFDIHFLSVDTAAAWRHEIVSSKMLDPKRVKNAFDISNHLAVTKEYLDIHCSTFTPKSFCDLIAQLVAAELLNFKCDKIFDTRYNQLEFRVILRKCDDKSEAISSWLNASAEILEDWSPLNPPRGARYIEKKVSRTLSLSIKNIIKTDPALFVKNLCRRLTS